MMYTDKEDKVDLRSILQQQRLLECFYLCVDQCLLSYYNYYQHLAHQNQTERQIKDLHHICIQAEEEAHHLLQKIKIKGNNSKERKIFWELKGLINFYDGYDTI